MGVPSLLMPLKPEESASYVSNEANSRPVAPSVTQVDPFGSSAEFVVQEPARAFKLGGADAADDPFPYGRPVSSSAGTIATIREDLTRRQEEIQRRMNSAVAADVEDPAIARMQREIDMLRAQIEELRENADGLGRRQFRASIEIYGCTYGVLGRHAGMASWRGNLHTNINVALLSNARGGHDATVLLSKSSYTEKSAIAPFQR